MRGGFERAAAAVLALGITLSACGGGSSQSDNGIASKSTTQIVNAASQAIQGVNSVHVAGSTGGGASSVKFDLDLVNGRGGRGSISATGLNFQIIKVGNTVYITGSDNFWRHFGGDAAAQLFHGKWLKATATGKFASFAGLTNLRVLFFRLLSSHGTLSKGSTTTINGHKAIVVRDTSKGGTLYVACTGNPYPIEVSKGGSDGGKVDFSRFNKPVSLTAPADAIDISQLKH